MNQSNIGRAFAAANNALYFGDSSDYEVALYEVCVALNPGMEGEYGSEYIIYDEKEEV